MLFVGATNDIADKEFSANQYNTGLRNTQNNTFYSYLSNYCFAAICPKHALFKDSCHIYKPC